MTYIDIYGNGKHMTHIVIIPTSKIEGHGWDMDNCKVLRFRNFRKLIFFTRYYSYIHDVLIRIYIDNVWTFTYCKGEEIWNCF